MPSILLISDDSALQGSVQQALASGDYRLRHLSIPERVEDLMHWGEVDLIILDLTTTHTGSPHPCQHVRSAPHLSTLPILCLLHSDEAEEIAAALDAGGDDCLRKPFIPRELAARVRALLRRPRCLQAATPPLIINSRDQTVRLHGDFVDLTPTEYNLLDALCQRPGEHLSANELLEHVWKYPPGCGDPALVRNHIRNLRRKLERNPDRPRIVISAHGRGYTVSVETLRR